MEGYLMQKGWFNQWKMKFVTCSNQKLCIYKSKGDKDGSVFNVLNCSIKLIEQSRWNRKYVFRVKTSSTKMYFAAEDETTLLKWTNTIQGRVQRASLLGAGVIRRESMGNDKEEAPKRTKRTSTIASLSRGDILGIISFDSEKYAESYTAAISQPDDPQAQYEFAERCGEFLAVAHAQSGPFFNMKKIKEIRGYNVMFVNSEERKDKMQIMKSLAEIAKMKVPGVYVPLQCIIDYCGQSIFFESRIDTPREALTPQNAELLATIKVPSESLKAVQDVKGRLWITEAKLPRKNPTNEQMNQFVEKIDNMEYSVYDSQSLNEALKSNGIPVSKLPVLAELTKIPSIRVLIQTEMMGRAAKQLFIKVIKDKNPCLRNEEVVNFFNLILGISDESKKYWNESLIPAIKEKYHIDLDRNIPLLHMTQLFFTLQYHTGADFSDINTYNFNEANPLNLDQLNSFNAVPHHYLVNLCFSMRNIKENPIKLLQGGYAEEAMLLINNQVSVYQSIYGEENIFVAGGLSLLSEAYNGIGDQDKAIICANGALNAGRTYHCALIPSYLTLIKTALPHEIEGFVQKAKGIVVNQLGESHWFIADILSVAAQAYQDCGKKDEAMASIQEAVSLVSTLLGSAHPKTSKCILIHGKLQRAAHQYAQAESLVQQALYSMKAAFGENSIQYGECLFEFADILVDEGKNDEAVTYSKQAYKIREPVYDADSVPVIESVQQLAVIYDQLNQADNAYEYYRKLITFLKKIEDEPIFQEVIRIIRNVLCLFFRTIGGSQRQLISQIKRRQLQNLNDLILAVFQKVLETDPVIYAQSQIEAYQKAAETQPFDNLAALYHLATDDIETLKWLEEHH